LYFTLPKYAKIRPEFFGGLLYVRYSARIYVLNEPLTFILYLMENFPLDLNTVKHLLSRYYGIDDSEEIAETVIKLYDMGLLSTSTSAALTKYSIDDVINNFQDEVKFVKRLDYLSAPIEVSLDITWNCNYRCIHCYLSCPRQTLEEPLSVDEIYRLIDELAKMRVFYLVIGGGEPLLRLKDVVRVIEYANQRGLDTVLVTNGYLLNEDVCKKLEEAGLTAIQIPIYGVDPQTHEKVTQTPNSYSAMLKALECLRKVRIPNKVVDTVLFKFNIQQIDEIISLAKKYNINTINILELKPVGRGEDIYHEYAVDVDQRFKTLNLIEEKHKDVKVIAEKPFFFVRNPDVGKRILHLVEDNEMAKIYFMIHLRCAASIGRRANISPDGYVFPCEFLMNDYKYALGSIRRESFFEIWHDTERWNGFRKPSRNAVCVNCPFYDLCGGKCKVLALNTFGYMNAPDPRCPYAKDYANYSKKR